VDYQAWEGGNNLRQGQGGTKVVQSGVDFWANGDPPRKYQVLGVATSEIGAGSGDEWLIRSAIASEVKSRGGDAALELGNNVGGNGVLINAGSGVFIASRNKVMRFAIIKYLD
jgi:hypothetical protein